ncbi:MAG: tetratricopeptide repeat protein [Longimicrobiales bacterium]|nr:tetratricopeptide repeat protein [Longimicrobiales bacterium]
MAKRRAKSAAEKKKRDKSQVELLPDLIEPAVDEGQDDEPAHEASAREVPAKPDVPKIDDVRLNAEPKVVRPAPERTPPPDDVTPPLPRPQGNQLARARDLVQTGRIEEAIELYSEILGENPHNLRAHNNLGILLDELGQHHRAVEHLEAALEVEPDNVEVLTNLASALTELARFAGADASIRKALRLSPDDPSARLAQGILSFRRGLYIEAEEELRWVCERDPGLGEAFYYRAEALNRTSQFPEATELMLRAAALLPDDSRPLYTLGHLYDRQGCPVEAAEMYRRVRDLQV